MVRTSNEDSCVANIKSRLFLVADGMGGHAAGEIASQIAASTVDEIISGGRPAQNMADLLQYAVQQANLRVYETQKLKPQYRGMGSTLTVLAFQEDRYYLAQVGDSRAYLFRDRVLSQLTQDHSVVWPLYESGILTKDDIAHHPQKNLITRSIGTHPDVEIDLIDEIACEGDIFLLCSDGLTDVLTDREIQQILVGSDRDPQQMSEMLISATNSGGGPDNVTTVVVYLAP
jgi:serine/threonine protein phosphatase PrpC